VAPSGNAVDISVYGCATVSSGNTAECCGSTRYGIVYHCPTCASGGSGSSTVIVFSTTDSQGSTYVTSTTSALPSTSVIVYSTTDSKGSTYITSSTSTASLTQATGPSVVVVTNTNTVVTTDSSGSTVTTIQTKTSSSTVTTTTSNVPTVSAGVCPGAGGVYSDASGHQYQIYCGTDFLYNDLITPHVSSLADCLAACDQYVPSSSVANGASCVAATYGASNVGGNCYLKFAITAINYGNGGIVAARMIGYSPSSSTSESLGQSTGSGTVQTSGTVSSSIVAYSTTDSKGSTYVTSTTSTTSIPPSTPTTTQSQATSANPPPASIISGTTSASTVNPSTAPFPCPDYDGKNYIDATGAVYGIECATNYQYSDLVTPHTGSMEACIAACDNYVPSSNVAGGQPCVGGTWSAGNPGGDCYLKFAITTKQYGMIREDSFFKYGYTMPSSSGGSTLGGSSTSTLVGQSTTQTPSTTSVTDGAGLGTTTTTSAGLGTTSTAPAPVSTVSSVSCPQNNNTRFTDVFGTTYDVKCGVDVIGSNLHVAHADSYAQCLEFCDILEGCAGVTFLDSTSSTSSNCYPYASFASYSYTSEVTLYSGIPVNGPSTGSNYNDVLCPQYNGTQYVDTFGKTYNISCGFNYGGSDLYATVTNTLEGCLTYCTTYNTCVGVDWSGPVSGTGANCYPKSALTTVTVQDQTQYAVRV